MSNKYYQQWSPRPCRGLPNVYELRKQYARLKKKGVKLYPRDPGRSTTWAGKWMLARKLKPHHKYPCKANWDVDTDPETGKVIREPAWCVVGDNIMDLLNMAWGWRVDLNEKE